MLTLQAASLRATIASLKTRLKESAATVEGEKQQISALQSVSLPILLIPIAVANYLFTYTPPLMAFQELQNVRAALRAAEQREMKANQELIGFRSTVDAVERLKARAAEVDLHLHSHSLSF